MTRDRVLKPGMFDDDAAANTRRVEFDYGNESLMLTDVRPDVLFIGDSITHLWELQAYFGGTGRILVNRGIGGDISAHVRRRFAADALQLRPHAIVLKIGTNDLGWEPAALNDALSDVVCDNIAAMTREARAADIRMMVCSLLPVWGPSWLSDADAAVFAPRKNAQIAAINARLRAMAAAEGAIYVDYHAEMADADGLLIRELADDGVHPHHAGYALMARVLRRALADDGMVL
ncbi:MAG TPA: GDSL-type esterase/lipase family protein [Armatimonadota bacterium]|nr:GDSL-type esterase/lipase family protein [Armatimonadota bacterium]HOS42691.1 GDSL-type esterase/lipase family protein [Armatimonadota bacterium]